LGIPSIPILAWFQGFSFGNFSAATFGATPVIGSAGRNIFTRSVSSWTDVLALGRSRKNKEL
jgi:hypothetical protein